MSELEPTEEATPIPLFPTFEGKDVHASALKIANSAVLELTDVVLAMDDIIQIVVEARVNGIDHRVHEASGSLVRVHTAKALNARLVPFNEDYDNGVV